MIDALVEAVVELVVDVFFGGGSSGSSSSKRDTGKYVRASRVKEGQYVAPKDMPNFDLSDRTQPRRLKVVYASTIKGEKGSMLLIVEIKDEVRDSFVLPVKQKIKIYKVPHL